MYGARACGSLDPFLKAVGQTSGGGRQLLPGPPSLQEAARQRTQPTGGGGQAMSNGHRVYVKTGLFLFRRLLDATGDHPPLRP
jgi:hypothetical protein